MDRRAFISGIASGLLVPGVARAQPAAKVYRIGYLGDFPLSAALASVRLWDAFTQALQQRGYVEGKNIAFEQDFERRKTRRSRGRAAKQVRDRDQHENCERARSDAAAVAGAASR